MTDIDPAAVMAAHASHVSSQMRNGCVITMQRGDREPCDPYRLAEALAASEAKVARVEAARTPYTCLWQKTGIWGYGYDPAAIDAALADQPERAS